VQNRWVTAVGAGLFAMASFSPMILAQTPATETEPKVSSDSKSCEDTYQSIADFMTENIQLRAGMVHSVYRDIKVTNRHEKRNDLGIPFTQPTVKAQNDAEKKSWHETIEFLDLLLLGGRQNDADLWFFLGLGSRQGASDFGTQRIDQESRPISAFSAGALGSLGEVHPGVRIDWEARATYVVTGECRVDQIPDASEEIKFREWSYGARLTVSFDPGPCGRFVKDGDIRLEPYTGVHYQHLNIVEKYSASSGTSVSRFDFDVQSPAKSDFRGIVGVRLLGLDPHADVALEGSFGAEVYGAGLVLLFRF
jgi:hypothetical protein